MSSVINTVYKRPSSILTVRGNDEDPSPQHNGNLIITCMWVIVALAAAARTEFSSALAGMTISLTVIDAAVMILVHLLMIWGLENKNQCCVLPWIGVSSWSMYNSQYKGIKKMWHVLKITKFMATLPWITFGINVAIFGLRIFLVIRVLNLVLNQWYEKKLETELNYNRSETH